MRCTVGGRSGPDGRGLQASPNAEHRQAIASQASTPSAQRASQEPTTPSPHD